MSIRIGIGFNTPDIHATSMRKLPSIAQAVEANGFDSLWITERVTGPGLDPVVALSAIAVATTKLKFGPSVMTLPGRQPAMVAKQLASVDALAPGRLIAAFGLGQRHPLEQHAFGVRREDRGPMMDESLPLLRQFWSGTPVTHSGRYFRYDALSIRPVPAKRSLDIWMGGASAREYDRVGRLADGWLASFMTPAEAGTAKQCIQNAASEAGRRIPNDHFGAVVTYARGPVTDRERSFLANRRTDQSQQLEAEDLLPFSPEALKDELLAYVDQGITKFVLLPLRDPHSWSRELEDLADCVLSLQTT